MQSGKSESHHLDTWNLNPDVLKLKPSAIREILKVATQPGIISFAGGLPAPEMFPLEDLKTIASEVFDLHGAASVQYTLTRGVTIFRQKLAERATDRGTATLDENILVTTGSQQGLELIARAFVQPGDYIITEQPSYVGGLQAFNANSARYLPVEIDENGMQVDRIESLIEKYHPKLIYVIPDFQNPTGVTMSLDRRKRLVEISHRHNIPLLDDSPYGDLAFSGERLPSLKSLGGEQVIALRTFSKLITPGIRVGWINARADLIAVLERLKQATDLHSSTFDQYVLYEFLKRGKLEPHLQRIREDYGSKCQLMLSVLDAQCPKEIRYTRPKGGLFLWLTLPEGISTHGILKEAVAQSVAYVHGQPFFPDGSGENTMRLNFSNASPQNIIDGITRLCHLFKTTLANRKLASA